MPHYESHQGSVSSYKIEQKEPDKKQRKSNKEKEETAAATKTARTIPRRIVTGSAGGECQETTEKGRKLRSYGGDCRCDKRG